MSFAQLDHHLINVTIFVVGLAGRGAASRPGLAAVIGRIETDRLGYFLFRDHRSRKGASTGNYRIDSFNRVRVPGVYFRETFSRPYNYRPGRKAINCVSREG